MVRLQKKSGSFLGSLLERSSSNPEVNLPVAIFLVAEPCAVKDCSQISWNAHDVEMQNIIEDGICWSLFSLTWQISLDVS